MLIIMSRHYWQNFILNRTSSSKNMSVCYCRWKLKEVRKRIIKSGAFLFGVTVLVIIGTYSRLTTTGLNYFDVWTFHLDVKVDHILVIWCGVVIGSSTFWVHRSRSHVMNITMVQSDVKLTLFSWNFYSSLISK